MCMFRRADRNRLRNLLIANSPSSVDEHCHGIPHLETLLVVENSWVWVQNTRSKLCRDYPWWSNESDVSWSAICDWLFAPYYAVKGVTELIILYKDKWSVFYWFMSFYDKRNLGRAFWYSGHLLAVSTRAIACTVVLEEWVGKIIIIRRLKLIWHFHIIRPF